MRRFPVLAVLASLPVALGAIGCGGAPAEPKTAGTSTSKADDSVETSRGGDAVHPPPPKAPPKPRCDDGSCFLCGDGLCPSGFYCDESANGGATCSWLPACSKGASCDCVARVLGAAAHCETSGGGPHVRD